MASVCRVIVATSLMVKNKQTKNLTNLTLVHKLFQTVSHCVKTLLRREPKRWMSNVWVTQ